MTKQLSFSKIDEAEFEKLTKALKPVVVPIEQSPIWGNFDDSVSGRTFLGTFRYDEDDKFVALASATLYRQKGRNWIWIKHGPLFASVPNTEMIKKMCSTLKQQFTDVDGIKPLFIRLSSPTKVKPLVAPFEHTMYDQTIVLDLTKSEDELLADMSKSGRQGLRFAQRENVEVKKIDQKELSKFEGDFYPLLNQTSNRSHFGVHSAKIYQTMLEHLQPHISLFGAYKEGRLAAWSIITEFNGSALYYYAASGELGRETQAPYILQWEIIKYLKAKGFEKYDLMGIASETFPELANVTTFKQKFSKEITKVTPTYDLPLQTISYIIISSGLKIKRKF